jgi:hypothetical protein
MTDIFIYYHCLKASKYSDTYACQPYSDPLRIPGPTDGSRIIPVRRWVPWMWHRYVIRYQLRKWLDVTVDGE